MRNTGSCLSGETATVSVVDDFEAGPGVDLSAVPPAPSGPPVSVQVLLDEITVDLPFGLRLAPTQPTVESMKVLEERIRRGHPIRVAVEPQPRYGAPRSGFCHLIRQVSVSVRNERPVHWLVYYTRDEWEAEQRVKYGPMYEEYAERGLADPYPEYPPWSTLTFSVSISGTWKCGNQGNNVLLFEEPTGQRCPACFGLPREHRPRQWGPAVRAIPEGREQCRATELLGGPRCRKGALWSWRHTPVCARHLELLRRAWVTADTEKGQ